MIQGKRKKRYLGPVLFIWVLFAACNIQTSASAGGEEYRIAAPVQPSLIPGNHKIEVRWTLVETAAGYEVWYGSEPDADAAQQWAGEIGTAGRLISAVIDKTHAGAELPNDTTYYVWVKAVFASGTSPFSPRSSASAIPTPGEPGGPAIVTSGDRNMEISWSAGSRAASYEIACDTQDGAAPPETASRNTTAATSVIINGLSNGATYYVWVCSVNTAGQSEYVKAAGSGTPHATGANAPAVISAAAGNKKLTVSWTREPGVYAYAVYGSAANNFAGAALKADNVLPQGITIYATVSGLSNGAPYYVWVRDC